jgi:hypothetical protein
MTPLERIEANTWLNNQNMTLQNFLWDAQPKVTEWVVKYIRAWADWQYQGRNKQLEKPAPFLFLWGPFETGKTELVARGLARYFVLNLCLPTVEYIYWPEYVKDQLNGKNIKPNWSAKLLVLDDFDGHRPIPESMSTWLVGDMLGILKPRAEVSKLPTLIITNRRLEQLEKFFSTSAAGHFNEDTKHTARQLMTALTRHTFASVEFQVIPPKYKKPENTPDYNQWLRQQALEKNDMAALGFLYPREKYGIEVMF